MLICATCGKQEGIIAELRTQVARLKTELKHYETEDEIEELVK